MPQISQTFDTPQGSNDDQLSETHFRLEIACVFVETSRDLARLTCTITGQAPPSEYLGLTSEANWNRSGRRLNPTPWALSFQCSLPDSNNNPRPMRRLIAAMGLLIASWAILLRPRQANLIGSDVLYWLSRGGPSTAGAGMSFHSPLNQHSLHRHPPRILLSLRWHLQRRQEERRHQPRYRKRPFWAGPARPVVFLDHRRRISWAQ